MANNDREFIIKIPSALFATLLSFGVMLLFLNKVSIWRQIGDTEHFWMLFAAIYAAILTVSGWLFVASKWRGAGLIHAALMFGIAGFVFYKSMTGILTSPGSDDAVAGVVAATNLFFVIVGVLAAFCGIGIAYLLFRKS